MTLASWIVVALVVLGVVALGLVAAPLLPKLRRLKRAGDVLKGRAEEAQTLQVELETLQARVLEVQAKVERVRPAR
ncbi:hypothetical protein [Cryptosporangium japonicum]|uniref:Uncharacterized protein n=1 Tax=Cryptosporangium japonicum TaxID=80872 RepID=A0ABP3EUX7_9ACTN